MQCQTTISTAHQSGSPRTYSSESTNSYRRNSRLHSGYRFLESVSALLEGQSWLQRVPDDPSDKIGRLLATIHKNLFDPGLNVKTLKNLCKIYDNNISCQFRSKIGQTIKEYLESQRMEAAVRLIDELQPISVVELAFFVGYEHVQTFYRAFRRRYGCTPITFTKLRANQTEIDLEIGSYFDGSRSGRRTK